MITTEFVHALLGAVDRVVTWRDAAVTDAVQAGRLARALIPIEMLELLDHQLDCRLAVAFVVDTTVDDPAWLFWTNRRAHSDGLPRRHWVDDAELLSQARELVRDSLPTGGVLVATAKPHFPASDDAYIAAVSVTGGAAPVPAGTVVLLSCSPIERYARDISNAAARAVGFASDALAPRLRMRERGFPVIAASDVTDEPLDSRDLMQLHRLLWYVEHEQAFDSSRPPPQLDDQKGHGIDGHPVARPVLAQVPILPGPWVGGREQPQGLGSQRAERVASAVAELLNTKVETIQPDDRLLRVEPVGAIAILRSQIAVLAESDPAAVAPLIMAILCGPTAAKQYVIVSTRAIAHQWGPWFRRLEARHLSIVAAEDLGIDPAQLVGA